MPKSKWGLKRQNEELLAEVKRLKQDNQCFEIRQSMQKLHEALKPRYVRLDELVNNTGLKHVALLIFKKLSPEDLGNCRLVSKGWKECIDNDKHWWQQVQFAHCKRVITTYRSVLDGKETLYEYCPELMDVIENVFQNESIENMKLFSEFMMNYEDYVTEKMEEDCGPSEVPEILGPLHYATEQEDFHILKMFVRSPMKNLNGEDWNNYDCDQKPLHNSLLGEAICRGQVKIIEFFMTEGREKVDFDEVYGCVSLFHEACRSNNAEIVKLFLDHATELKIDLNVKDDIRDGMTPFMFTKTKEVAELILGDERIDVNATDNGNGTILDYLCGRDETLYHEDFTEEQIVETLDFLLHSHRIDYPNEDVSPLHTACFYGHEARVETILKVVKEKGIDINQKNRWGQTPLHYAFSSGFKEPTTVKELSPTLDLMLKHAKDFGIDLEATDYQKSTPLHCLYEENHKENHENVRNFLQLVKKEYKIEFNLKATDKDGKTPTELSRNYKRSKYFNELS